MKNTNTTLELPEGSKATIQGKVIDGKNYLVVEVESKSDMIDIEEKYGLRTASRFYEMFNRIGFTMFNRIGFTNEDYRKR